MEGGGGGGGGGGEGERENEKGGETAREKTTERKEWKEGGEGWHNR